MVLPRETYLKLGLKNMPLFEVDLSLRAVMLAKDAEDAKAKARAYEDDIMADRGAYKVLVLPFNPASWDFGEYPYGCEDENLTIGDIYNLELTKSLGNLSHCVIDKIDTIAANLKNGNGK